MQGDSLSENERTYVVVHVVGTRCDHKPPHIRDTPTYFVAHNHLLLPDFGTQQTHEVGGSRRPLFGLVYRGMGH